MAMFWKTAVTFAQHLGDMSCLGSASASVSGSAASSSLKAHGYISPGTSVHGILQARILEWVAIPFSRGSFLTQGWNPGLLHYMQFLYHLSYQGTKVLKNQSVVKPGTRLASPGQHTLSSALRATCPSFWYQVEISRVTSSFHLSQTRVWAPWRQAPPRCLPLYRSAPQLAQYFLHHKDPGSIPWLRKAKNQLDPVQTEARKGKGERTYWSANWLACFLVFILSVL